MATADGGYQRFVLGQDGEPVPSGQLLVSPAGTTTPSPLFSDQAMTVAAVNPLIADGTGFIPSFYIGIGRYDYRYYDADGVLLYTVENVNVLDYEEVTDLTLDLTTAQADILALESSRVLRAGDTMTGTLNISSAGTANLSITDTAGDDQVRFAVASDVFALTWRDSAGVFDGTIMRFVASDNTVRFTDYVVRFEQDIDMEQNSIADCGPIAFTGTAPTGDYIDWTSGEGLIGRENGVFKWRIGTNTFTTIESVYEFTVGDAANVTVDASGLIRRASSRLAWKGDVEPVTGCLDRILQIDGYTFTWLESGRRHQGLIADYLEQVNSLYVEGDSPSAPALIADLIGAVKELTDRLEALEGR